MMYLAIVAIINILCETVSAVTSKEYVSESNYTMCETTLPYVNIVKGKCSYSCSRIKPLGFSNGQNFVCYEDGTQPVMCINGKCEIGDCEIVVCEKDDFTACFHKRKYSRARMCVDKATKDDGVTKTNFIVIDAVLFGLALTVVIILRYTVKRVSKRQLTNQNIALQGQTRETFNNNRNSYSPVPTNAVNTNDTAPPKYNEILHNDESPPPSYKEAIELQIIASTTSQA